MMNQNTLLLLLCFILAGCGLRRIPLQPEVQTIKNYELNQAKTSTIGSPMIVVARIVGPPTYAPSHEYKPPMPRDNWLFAPPLKPDQVWFATAATADGGLLLRSSQYDLSDEYSIHITPDGKVNKGWVPLPPSSFRQWDSDFHFNKLDLIAETGSFSAELVYSGIDDQTLHLLYREYFDGTARPAFTQELTYSLVEDRMIAFKSLSIEIISANNSQINYKVVEDGKLPWLPQR